MDVIESKDFYWLLSNLCSPFVDKIESVPITIPETVFFRDGSHKMELFYTDKKSGCLVSTTNPEKVSLLTIRKDFPMIFRERCRPA